MDLPGLTRAESNFDTLAQEAARFGNPDRARRDLESWGFILGYDASFTGERFDVDAEIWLLATEQGAANAFRAIVQDFAAIPGLVTVTGFPALGAESRVLFTAERFTTRTGQSFTGEVHIVVVRRGQFMAVLFFFALPGQISRTDVTNVAAGLDARMKSQVP